MTDILDTLFVDHIEKDWEFRQKMADLLLPYIFLDGRGRVHFTTRYHTLNLQGRVFLYLMGRWVLHVEGVRDEGATAKQIAQDTALPDNSVRPTLALLCDIDAVRKRGKWGDFEYLAIPINAEKVTLLRWKR